jgi:hypothetical protein
MADVEDEQLDEADEDEAEGADLRNALSGLQKARAPESFAQDVTATIHKRSAGAFFGRRTFGDRVPFGALLVVALIAIAMIGFVLWRGSVHVDDRDAPAGSGATIITHP